MVIIVITESLTYYGKWGLCSIVSLAIMLKMVPNDGSDGYTSPQFPSVSHVVDIIQDTMTMCDVGKAACTRAIVDGVSQLSSVVHDAPTWWWYDTAHCPRECNTGIRDAVL